MTPPRKTVPAADARPPAAAHADIVELPYEAARDELISIVQRLEGGQVDLEESMRLWERGEALADHCASWLDGAERRLRGEDRPPAGGRGGATSKPQEADVDEDSAGGAEDGDVAVADED